MKWKITTSHPGRTNASRRSIGVATTPQTFIGGKRIGGYDDLRRFPGEAVAILKRRATPP
jgi:glutaredoxin